MKKLLLICCISFACATAFADDTEELSGAPDPGNVPIDGGISLLLAAGAAYGGHRLQKVSRNKKAKQ